ncbi:hypothetical protein B296_00000015 [Ensete ventricosum]|uniref:Gfo/Idh/MocA-like oxidoreductase N-terminal domain-containing protein n=1 Tax=Ensete ventricosum TaxID=4639 RepID=A0A427AM77_ENSVE|nr:hypothetical protein B296_00000015 [Ensete ventricosum]
MGNIMPRVSPKFNDLSYRQRSCPVPFLRGTLTKRVAKQTLAVKDHIRPELTLLHHERNGGRDSEEKPDTVRRLGVLGDLPQAQQCLRSRPIVAVGSRSLDKARRFIAENGFPVAAIRAIGSYEAVLDDPGVGAVYMPLPTSLHVQWVVGGAECGKHLLLEKPTALCASDLDRIPDACRSRGRSRCLSCCPIRPELHGRRLMITQILLIRRISSLFDSALCYTQLILSCGSSLLWKDGKVSTLSCGSSLMRGSLQLGDFVIPFEEEKVPFSFASGSAFNGLVTGWQPLPAKHIVPTDLPQESLMVQEFSRLAGSIIDSAGKPDDQWPAITSNRQLIVRGCVPVEIV